MNEAHLHLIINHFPIIVPIIALFVLLSAWLFSSNTQFRTSYVLFIFAAITALIASATGERAEELVEHLPDISKKMIHEHEEWGEKLALLSYLLGIMSAIALWANIQRKKFERPLAMALTVLALVTLFLGKQAGTTGGELRHTEIRANATNNANVPDVSQEEEEGED